MSILVFQTSVAPHVQQAARAIFEAGQLERFITSVRDNPGSLLQRAASSLGRMLGRDFPAQFRRRAVTEIPLEKVESHPLGEWLRIGAMAADRSGRLGDLVWERTERSFDRMVARRLSASLSAVYGFEHSSQYTFERARSIGLRTVYDVPAPETYFVHRLMEAEMERFPELTPLDYRQTKVHEERRIARRRAEWNLSDLILVNSKFTRESYERAGLSCENVRVANLGAPPPVSIDVCAAAGSSDGPTTFIWAGTFGIRKGAHYLLDAWRAGNFGRRARLRVYGAVALPDRVVNPLPEGVELCGSIPRAQLYEQYMSADALVFPTLCDGFGMVATEAWSRGLPVITTDRAGVVDLLRPGRNGLLVRAGDVASLRESIDWCISNRPALRAMREDCIATAAGWQWSDYRTQHAGFLRAAGMFGKAS
jgi:glycosyltransferase involved in cell wall biosynthesis